MSREILFTMYMVKYFMINFLFRLEGKKRQKKPEIKDPKLQELQDRLEARKAGKWNRKVKASPFI